MTTKPTAQDSLRTLGDFLASVNGEQQKQAEAHTEAGSQGGATSHPVKDVDDRTEAAQEGARSGENTADVKEDQGPPSVENTPEAKPKMAMEGSCDSACGSAADDHMQIGTNIQATGDDPENETGKAKAGKEDPGTSHPAKTDNDALDGHKFAQDQLDAMPLNQLSKLASDAGDDFLAYITVQADNQQKQAEVQPTSSPAPHTKEAETQYRQLADRVGWDVAGLVVGNIDKTAADAMVEQTLYGVIKEASADADRVATYLRSYSDAVEKQAMGGEMGGMPPEMGAGGGMPPEMGAGGGMPPEMGAGGGMPPEAGGDPAAMLDALGGGAPPAEGGGGGGEMDLQSILQQLGVTEEELMQAIAAEEGGEGGGGMPPETGGGMPPAMGGEMGGAPEEPPMEVEAADKRAEVVGYIQEVVSRSRAKRAVAAK